MTLDNVQTQMRHNGQKVMFGHLATSDRAYQWVISSRQFGPFGPEMIYNKVNQPEYFMAVDDMNKHIE